MSMDPATMQQMLMQQLQSGAPSPVGGGMGGPQMQGQTSPMNAAAQLAQKAMLVRSLQNNPNTPANSWQQHQANAMVPGTQAMSNPAMSQNPQIQAMQQSMQAPMQPPPMQPMMDPSLQPIPGYS